MSPIALSSQRAAVLHGPKDLRIESRTAWPPSQGQLQIAVQATGLCGSDLHYYVHGRNGDFALQAPLVLGHEAAGIITALGPGVMSSTSFRVGQRVAIEAGIMCNQCSFCDKGRYNLCKNMRFASSAKTFPHLDGTLQELMNHPARVVHALPDGCSFEQAALAEPLSVLIHAARRASLGPSSSSSPSHHPKSVLVLGAGTVGLLACALSKSLGASHVVVVDINQQRLEFAKNNGFAQHAYCMPPSDRKVVPTTDEQMTRARENAAELTKRVNEPEGFDVVFECTGVESCIQMSIYAAATGGKVMLIGMGTRNIMLPLSTAALREVDIQGSFRYANTYPEALSLLASNSLPHVEKLVTHRYSLQESAKAFEALAAGKDEDGGMVIKVMIGP